MVHLRARVALASALANPNHAQKLLSAAAHDAKRIEKEKPEWCRALATLIRASIASQNGDRANAVRLFAAAGEQAEQAGMKHFENAAGWQSARLDDDSRKVDDIEKSMSAQAIQNAQRMSALLAPA